MKKSIWEIIAAILDAVMKAMGIMLDIFNYLLHELVELWEQRKKREVLQTQTNVRIMYERNMIERKKGLKREYDSFSNAIVQCIKKYCSVFGLIQVSNVTDVQCVNIDEGIVINDMNGSTTFVYIMDQEIEASIQEGKFRRAKNVSPEAIEQKLNQSLRKYANDRGYVFSGVKVDDIPGEKIRVTVFNVRLTQEEILKRNGYDTYNEGW